MIDPDHDPFCLGCHYCDPKDPVRDDLRAQLTRTESANRNFADRMIAMEQGLQAQLDEAIKLRNRAEERADLLQGQLADAQAENEALRKQNLAFRADNRRSVEHWCDRATKSEAEASELRRAAAAVVTAWQRVCADPDSEGRSDTHEQAVDALESTLAGTLHAANTEIVELNLSRKIIELTGKVVDLQAERASLFAAAEQAAEALKYRSDSTSRDACTALARWVKI